MAERPDDATERVSSSQGEQMREGGESSRPPQSDDDIFKTQVVAAVTMFSQVMQNPSFWLFCNLFFRHSEEGHRNRG